METIEALLSLDMPSALALAQAAAAVLATGWIFQQLRRAIR